MIPYRSLIAAIAMAPLLASCVAQPIPPERLAQTEARLAKALAGKVAGKPVSCLPHFRANDMDVIDDDTILFRNGSTIYLQNTRGGCYPYGGNIGGYALVTKGVGGGSGLCEGDIARVIHTSTGFFAGSCSFNAFIPYRSAAR